MANRRDARQAVVSTFWIFASIVILFAWRVEGADAGRFESGIWDLSKAAD